MTEAVRKECKLPPIPEKRYFTIGETGELCGLKPHVLRYWEQEFSQLKPVTRRGNRRYYQHKDIVLVRQIRALLYEQGFTIDGARKQLSPAKKRVAANQTLAEEQAILLDNVCEKLEIIANDLELG